MNYLNPFDLINSHNLFKKIRKEMFEIVDNSEYNYPSSVKATHASDGSIKFPDAYVLKKLLEEYEPASILEVGSFLGFSTRWLLESSYKWNAKVTSIDPDIRHRIFDHPASYLKKFNEMFYPERLEVIRGFFGTYGQYVYNSYERFEPKKSREEVDAIVAEIPVIDKNFGSKYDFIFIDGNHSYDSVMNNFELAEALLNDRGCIAFHDVFTWKGVHKALMEIKEKYRGKAEVNIHGTGWRHVMTNIKKTKILPKMMNDGIGVFRSKA